MTTPTELRSSALVERAEQPGALSPSSPPSCSGEREVGRTTPASRIAVHLADMRAECRRELARLNLRPWQGGPYLVVREGKLLASWPDGSVEEVTDQFLAALRSQPARAQ